MLCDSTKVCSHLSPELLLNAWALGSPAAFASLALAAAAARAGGPVPGTRSLASESDLASGQEYRQA